MPPHYIGLEALVQNSMIAEGCHIDGTVDFSVIFSGVTIEEGAVVKDSIVMPNTTIKKGAVVEYAIVGQDCMIGEDVTIGTRPELMEDKSKWGVTVIGHDITINSGSVIEPKQIIDTDI